MAQFVGKRESMHSDAVGRSRTRAAALFLFLLALALLSAWEEVFFLNSIVTFEVEFSGHQVYFASKGVVLLLFSIFCRRLSAGLLRPSIVFAGGGALLFSTVCLIAAMSFDVSASASLVFVGCILGGAGFALLLLVWFTQSCWANSTAVLVLYIVSGFASALLSAFCASLGVVGSVAVACAMGLGAVAFSFAAFKMSPEEPDYGGVGDGSEISAASCNSGGVEPPGRFPSDLLWRVAVLMGAQRFPFAFNEALATTSIFGMGSHSSAGYLLAFAAILLCIVLRWNANTFVVLARYALPAAAVVFLALPRSTVAMDLAANSFASVYCAINNAVAVLLLAMACRCGHAKPATAFGLVFGVGYCCVAAGESVFLAMSALGMADGAVDQAFGIIAVVSLVVLVVALPDANRLRSWASPLDEQGGALQGMVEGDEVSLEAGNVHILSRQYGLTLREEEILGLIAEGMSADEIGASLFITKETVRTHCRHIYAKFGVSSRDELMGLMAS